MRSVFIWQNKTVTERFLGRAARENAQHCWALSSRELSLVFIGSLLLPEHKVSLMSSHHLMCKKVSCIIHQHFTEIGWNNPCLI